MRVCNQRILRDQFVEGTTQGFRSRIPGSIFSFLLG
jgi:hypothetical protein